VVAAIPCSPDAADVGASGKTLHSSPGTRFRCSDWQCGEGLAVLQQGIAQGWELSCYKKS
jgi:hypothetical protein